MMALSAMGGTLAFAMMAVGVASTAMADVTYGMYRCPSGGGRPDGPVVAVSNILTAASEPWVVKAVAGAQGHGPLAYLPIATEATVGCQHDTLSRFVDGAAYRAAEIELQQQMGGSPIVGTTLPITDANWFFVE